MNTFIKTLGLAAVLVLALCAGQLRAQDDSTAPADRAAPDAANSAPANDDVSFQTFYDQLANQGSWVQTDQYGYVFQPTESDPNWRPYTYGHWVNTDAGLTWVSDESFGWATYHYGRWVNLDGYGWVWVPGYTWAPAWVSWREGDDEVGWAPLPPDSDQGIDYYSDDDYYTGVDFGFGFHIGDDCDVAYGIGPAWYNFCPVAYIGDRDCWRHFRDHRDNFAFIGRTRNVTNLNFRRDGAGRFGHVRAEGPSVAALNARAGTPIGQARLTSASRLDDAGLRGDRLAVYAPRVNPATVRTARPSSVSERLANTGVNRGTDITRPLAVNSHVRSAAPTAEQVRAATVAQGNVPSTARVATANTRISHPLTQPLTTLRAGTRSTSTFGTGIRSNPVTQTGRGPVASIPAESRLTGEPSTRQATIPRNTAPVVRSASSGFTGGGFQPASVYHPSAPAYYHPQASTPVFHPSAPAYYHPQASFQSSAPAFHSSAPAYHPQQTFHSFAPTQQPHFGGGGFGGGAPAAHFSGGGGGAVHASAGGAAVGGGQGGGGHR